MYIKPIEKEKAKNIIINNHYTGKWSSCRYSFGILKNDKIVGVCIYGYPVGRRVVKSITPSMEKEDVLELTRLWTEDSLPKNTESWFLGKTFKWLRENTSIKVLIAYSDPMYDHVGYIYQATNWIYQGNNTRKVKSYIHYINNEYLHPRECVRKYKTTKEKELKKIDPDYKRILMEKKHRYIYILNKKNRKKILNELKYPSLPYPKK